MPYHHAQAYQNLPPASDRHSDLRAAGALFSNPDPVAVHFDGGRRPAKARKWASLFKSVVTVAG